MKYPAYSVLLDCMKLPTTSTFILSSERADFIRTAVELVFLTCLISPLNSEELIAEQGVPILSSLLDFFVNVARTYSQKTESSDTKIDATVASQETVADTISFIVRIISGVGFYETGRDSLKTLHERSCFLQNWRRCLDGSLFVTHDGKMDDKPIKRFALEGVANFALDLSLQDAFIGCGVVWPLLQNILQFDPTLEQQTQSDFSDFDDICVSVAANNVAARLSVRALGVLSGLYGSSSKHQLLATSLETFLTIPIARMLRNKRTGVILSVLSCNVERADLIWNDKMRQQLESLLSSQVTERAELGCREATKELEVIGEFRYETLEAEIRIAGIYVRCFVKDGKDALSHVENPNQFFDAIVGLVARSMNALGHFEGWINIPVIGDSSLSIKDPAASSSYDSAEFVLAMNALLVLCRVEELICDVLLVSSSMFSSTILSLLELPLQSQVSVSLVDAFHWMVRLLTYA